MTNLELPGWIGLYGFYVDGAGHPDNTAGYNPVPAVTPGAQIILTVQSKFVLDVAENLAIGPRSRTFNVAAADGPTVTAWDAETTYAAGAIVGHTAEGAEYSSFWLATAASTNSAPASDSTDWVEKPPLYDYNGDLLFDVGTPYYVIGQLLDEAGDPALFLPMGGSPKEYGWSVAVRPVAGTTIMSGSLATGLTSGQMYRFADVFAFTPASGGTPTIVGPDGDSAYQVAVSQGFVGTESDWLATLAGYNVNLQDNGDGTVTFVPGPTDPVAAAQAAAEEARDEAQAAAASAETYSATTETLQDAAVAGLIGTSGSQTETALNGAYAPGGTAGTYGATQVDANALAAFQRGHGLRARLAGRLRSIAPCTLGALRPSTQASAVATDVCAVTGASATNTFTTAAAHGLVVGQAVQILNRTGLAYIDDGTYYVMAVPTATTFQVYVNHGTGGAVQYLGSDGTGEAYTNLPTTDTLWDRTLRTQAVTITAANDTLTTAAAHGLVVGQAITLTANTATGLANDTTYYVATVATTTTLTVSATRGGAAIDITADGTATLMAANSKFTFGEGRPVPRSNATPLYQFVQSDPGVSTVGAGTLDQSSLSAHTIFSGTQVEALIQNDNTNTEIWVDGALLATVTPAQLVAAGIAAGYAARMLLTFPDARPRRLTLRAPTGRALYGWAHKPTDPLSAPVLAHPARVLVVGDSYAEGTGDTSGTGFVRWAQLNLGLDNVWRCGEGSTGYLTAGTRVALVNRYQNDVIDQAPDVAVIAMGLNDENQTAADVVTAATTVWDAITAQLPATQLVIVGPWSPVGNTHAPTIRHQINDGLKTAAAARGLRFISPLDEGWITGTGHVGAPAGDGNADTYISNDGTHPSNAGHDYLGWRLAGHLALLGLAPA